MSLEDMSFWISTLETQKDTESRLLSQLDGLQLSDIDKVIYPVWVFIIWPQQFVVSEDVSSCKDIILISITF